MRVICLGGFIVFLVGMIATQVVSQESRPAKNAIEVFEILAKELAFIPYEGIFFNRGARNGQALRNPVLSSCAMHALLFSQADSLDTVSFPQCIESCLKRFACSSFLFRLFVFIGFG